MSGLSITREARIEARPPPEWADVPAFEIKGSGVDRALHGRCAWLSDTQISLLGTEPVILSRSVQEVTSPDGLQASGRLLLDFDPTYEVVTLHHVRILRAGKVRDVNPLDSLEFLRRERNIERAIFDGRLTASMSFPDVQVGDFVDICHSTRGGHPILDNKFCGEFLLNWQCWVGETRVRLIASAKRPLAEQRWNGAPACSVEITPDEKIIRTWKTTETAAETLENHVPSETRQLASVRICDEMSWADVAATFMEFYKVENLPQDLDAYLIETLKNTKDRATILVLALRLVQSGLRYQSVSIGDGGFSPRTVEKIWESRTGDCKDASLLLVSILKRLDFFAVPALVNTHRGLVLNNERPSLVAFNHCVVRVVHEGTTYWLDPTQFPQGGNLNTLCQPRFGWALPLALGADLESMGEDALSDSYTTVEIYDLPRGLSEPGSYTATSTFFGWRADLIRRQIANGLDVFSREREAWYASQFETANMVEPINIEDDLSANRIVVSEKVKLGRVWRTMPDGRAEFIAPDAFFNRNLPSISPEGRRLPIRLGPLLRAESTIEIKLPRPAPPKEWDVHLSCPGVRISSKMIAIDSEKKHIQLKRTLIFDQINIQATDARALKRLREELTSYSSVAIRLFVHNGYIGSPKTKKKKFAFSNNYYLYFLLLIAIAILNAIAQSH